MAPNSSQISALSALTMSNFALEAREEYTSHPRFLQLRRSRDRRTARWLCPFGPAYFFRPFLPSGKKEYAVLRIPPKKRSSLHSAAIINLTIAYSHTFFLELKTILVLR